ncbi:MAG: 4Fe-4S binding protein [Chloroflexi bacterium]|nr:4Fe-4S binding protein [Chloroflexota bacterium]
MKINMKTDLSVEVAGIKFKNPVVVGASDLTYDVRGIRQCVDNGVGSIVMKTLSTQAYSRTKTCPFHFSLERFGRSYQGGAKCSTESYSLAPPEVWLREVGPEAVRICHDAGAVFIGSVALQVGDDMGAVIDLARKLEKLGADMLEVPQYLCPNDLNIPEDYVECHARNISAIRAAIGIPVCTKINAFISAKDWLKICLESEKAGASMIDFFGTAEGIFVDVEREQFYGVPAINSVMHGQINLAQNLAKIIEAKQAGVIIPFCGTGGVWDWRDAVALMLVGASLVGVCSSAYVKSRRVFRGIVDGLENWMEARGYRSVAEFTGKLLPRVRKLEELVPEVYPVPAPITPVIDYERCNFCGRCLEGCIYGGIEEVDRERGRVVVDKELCWGCGMCVSRCPTYAMKLVDKSGAVYWEGRGEAKLWR